MRERLSGAPERGSEMNYLRMGYFKPTYLLGAVALVLAVTFTILESVSANHKESENQTGTEVSAITDSIINENYCPCGCGNSLPGSASQPACFGCSVGKAEVSRVHEALQSGESRRDVSHLLKETVLIDVFSDYTDKDLPEIWSNAKLAAAELGLQRVVLRTPGRTEDAQNAIRLAECARRAGRFFELQEALVVYQGPWDMNSLFTLGHQHGLAETRLSSCLQRVDVNQQVSKDRQHARNRGITTFPTVSVNRSGALPSIRDMREAIRKILLKETI